jgi:hypothetical protein
MMDGAAQAAGVVALIAGLRAAEERLLDGAERLGLLIGLGVEWAEAVFAPPVGRLSLRKTAPQVLALGRDLIFLDNPKPA